MNAVGSPTPDGPGNGTPPRANPVDTSYGLYQECRAYLEARYPRLRDEQFFPQLEAYMVVCEIEDDARQVRDTSTWILTTPEDFFPVITVYFTYQDGEVRLRAAWADE